MHSQGVVHLDLKAENIMFDEVECTVKLIDFGYAQAFPDKKGKGRINTIRPIGTDGTIDPLNWRKQSFLGQEADLFAAAAILFVIRCGQYPF